MAASETVHSLARRTPCEPDRVLRHTGCDLPLSDELLLASRQAGVEIAMLGDVGFGGGASGKGVGAGCSNVWKRRGEKSTVDLMIMMRGHDDESIVPIRCFKLNVIVK